MSDDGGSIDYKREQRLAALEEKRKKLAEAKLKNQSARPVGVSTPPTTPVKQLEGVGSSWNDIVATIESMPLSATSTPVKSTSESGTGQTPVAAKPAKQLKPLSQAIGIAQVDFAPKREVQMYSRGTQTASSASQEVSSETEPQEPAARSEGVPPKLTTRSTSSDLVEPLVAAETSHEVVEQPEIVKKMATVLSEAESRSTVESSDFLRFMSQSAAIMDRALLLSERYDVLEGKYDEMEVAPRLQTKVESRDVEKIMTLFDKEYSLDQQFNDIDWNPFEKSKVISATFDQNGGSGSAILEFNLDYDGRLENRLLFPASRITTTKYWTSADSTYNTGAGGGRLIIGGSYTGQVVLWDVRAAGNRNPIVTVSNSNTSASSVGSSALGGPASGIGASNAGISPHKHPIYSLQIIDNRHFASVDTLGTLAIWDIYKMSHPVEELSLTWVKTGFMPDASAAMAMKDPSKPLETAAGTSSASTTSSSSSSSSSSNEVAVTGISFRDENSFFIASEDGSLFSGQRHGDRKGLLQHFRGHQATLSAVRVHPSHTALPPHFTAAAAGGSFSSSVGGGSPLKYSLNDLILTSSVDWSVSLWHPKLSNRPLATFMDFTDYVMDVAWSNHHPAMFAAVDSAGVLSIWNMNSEEREVALLTNSSAAPHALHKVMWSPHQADLLVAASHTSHLHVFKVDSEVVTPAADEWSKLENTVEDFHQQLLQIEREEASMGLDSM